MASISLLSWLILVVTLMVFLALVLRRRVSAPVCGKCSYEVRGLPSFVCPECGSDLREVGIAVGNRRFHGWAGSMPVCGECRNTVRDLPTFACSNCGSDVREVGIMIPAARDPRFRPALAALWTFALFVLALVISAVVSAQVPQVQDSIEIVKYRSPFSGAYATFDLESHSRSTAGSGMRVIPDELVFSLGLNPGPTGKVKTITMRLDVQSNRCSYSDSADKPVVVSIGLSAETLSAWMAAAGVDVKNPKVQIEVAEVMSAAQSLLGRPVPVTMPSGAYVPFLSHGSGTSLASSSPRWVLPLLVGFWLFVWGLGILHIARMTKSPWA